MEDPSEGKGDEDVVVGLFEVPNTPPPPDDWVVTEPNIGTNGLEMLEDSVSLEFSLRRLSGPSEGRLELGKTTHVAQHHGS